MKIAICSSLDFAKEIKGIAEALVMKGHSVIVPPTAELIMKGELSLEQVKKEKETGEISKRTIANDAIRRYYNKIKNSDAVVVLNFEKKGIKNYVGGNVFLEMGFAHVLMKKIYLMNDIPVVSYADEIRAMQPVVLKGDLSRIR